MRLTTPKGIIYAIDAERQGTSEGYALGLILTPIRDELNYEDIEDILSINAANRGVWGESTQGRATNKRKRSPVWFTNVAAYSDGLVKPIHELLNGFRQTHRPN
ncbi:hypothetical protein A4249_14105 [Brevundimonas sp. GW460-12-10-14-LB2]|uniref:hypothetical protein n=1 Tax=Brevundimonas sp. GW460-12-10-14-LB2 TaxID=1827469 RepID=UPI0007BCC211|nr:hypothetical protein [Brevundimonas sp. GW460-12-10-14-LB2]ANC54675.1 hypothetical protein A4249_14105 [Brevundimonas sp. GW460-12-10-14-LB2]